MALRIKSAGLSDKGRKRSLNEDNFRTIDEERLYVVADGMGGHNAGEIASSLAINTLVSFFLATSKDRDVTWPYKMDRKLNMAENRLKVGIRMANSRIHETSRKNSDYKGMGTTIVCAYVEGDTAYLAHAGDSRVYLLRDGALRQVTEDHSLLNQTLKYRKLTPEEIEKFPNKNVILRALGVQEDIEVELQRLKLQPGDRLVLCSDGLSNMVPFDELQGILALREDLPLVARRLIDSANEHGGTDNITAVLMEAEEDGAVGD